MKENNIKKNKNMLNNKNGITLIALVITIIVMLILVGVTINMAVNGGLFGYAGKATSDTEKAKQDELKIAEGGIEVDGKKYDSPNDYISGYESGVEKFSKIYTETLEYTDKNGDSAIIPKGFAVGLDEDINKIANGLVIQDESGNQFVWVPVNYTKTGNEDSHGLDEGFKSVFYRTWWSNNEKVSINFSSHTEPFANGYTNESSDFYAMMQSVQKYNGFYIGRFEAGTTFNRGKSTTPGTNSVIVKRDVYPYNFVCWGISMNNYTTPKTSSSSDYGYGAVYLCKNMYNPQRYGVTSTLCYSVEWDAILDFIIKNDNGVHNVSQSATWGNHFNSVGDSWEISRQTAQYSQDDGKTWNYISTSENSKISKTSNGKILLTTGANDNFKAKNIYDLAGNCEEWVMEADQYEAEKDTQWAHMEYCRVFRGGSCSINCTYSGSADFRGAASPGLIAFDTSFRPALYIN